MKTVSDISHYTLKTPALQLENKNILYKNGNSMLHL
jgi:hypothetical protein